MKTIFYTVTILLLLVAITSYSQAFAVVQHVVQPITVNIHKIDYNYGDTIGVSGMIDNYSQLPIDIKITDPAGNLVLVKHIHAKDNNSYSTRIEAEGSLWKVHGTYIVTVTNGNRSSESTFQFDSFNNMWPHADITAPSILIPTHVVNQAYGGSGAIVQYDVKAIDDTDGTVNSACDYSSGKVFPPGLTKVSCFAADSSQNIAARSFLIAVQNGYVVPPWAKHVAKSWCNGETNSAGFVDSLQYLITHDTAVIQDIQYDSDKQQVPLWVKHDACWWSSNQISDDDYAAGIQYLVANEIIKFR